MRPAPAHRALAAFDIERSGEPDKIDDIQRATRLALAGILREAVDGASIGWSCCTWLDRGDGGVLVAPGETESRVVDPLIGHLVAGLRRYNRRSSAVARLRLRMAAHSGPLHADHDGVTGTAMVHLARLLDARALRAALAAISADLAVLVSDSLYDRVVRHDYGLMDPAAFHPVDVRVKETCTRAWLLVSGEYAARPSDERPVAPAPRSGNRPPVGTFDRPAEPPGGTHVSIGAVHGVAVVGRVTGFDSLANRES
jgi:hypothetical protein